MIPEIDEDPTSPPLSGSIAELMTQQMNFKFEPAPVKQSPIERLLNRVPLFEGFLRGLYHASGHLDRLSEVAETQENVTEVLHVASPGVPVVDIAFLSIDFLRVPIIYLAAIIANEKPPFTLSNNARWLYASVLLALTITAIALPVVASPLGLAAASITLAASLVTMGKILYDRYKLRKEQKELEIKIASNIKLMEEYCKKVKELESDPIKNKLAIESLQLSFNNLLAQHKADLQAKHNCDELLKKKGLGAMLDKGVTIALASLALTGLVLTLFFPPVGFALLAATAFAGITYLLARVTAPIISRWLNRSPSRIPDEAVSPAKPSEVSEGENLKPTFENAPTIAVKPEDPLDDLIKKGATIAVKTVSESSTTRTMGLLMTTGTSTLSPIHAAWASDLHTSLSSMIETSNLSTVIAVFTKIAEHIQTSKPRLTSAELKEIFNAVDDDHAVFALVKQAISAVSNSTLEISAQDRSVLLACKPLAELFREKGISLDALGTTPMTAPLSNRKEAGSDEEADPAPVRTD